MFTNSFCACQKNITRSYRDAGGCDLSLPVEASASKNGFSSLWNRMSFGVSADCWWSFTTKCTILWKSDAPQSKQIHLYNFRSSFGRPCNYYYSLLLYTRPMCRKELGVMTPFPSDVDVRYHDDSAVCWWIIPSYIYMYIYIYEYSWVPLKAESTSAPCWS